MPENGSLAVCSFKGGLTRERMVVSLGGLIPQCTLWTYNLLDIQCSPTIDLLQLSIWNPYQASSSFDYLFM